MRKAQPSNAAQPRRLQLMCLSIVASAAFMYVLYLNAAPSGGLDLGQLSGMLAPDDPDHDALKQVCKRMQLVNAPGSAGQEGSQAAKQKQIAAEVAATAKATAAGAASEISAGAIPRNEFPEDKYGDQYLAMVLVVKDSHEDVREWVTHHRKVGAGTVYVYDDAESDASPVKDVIKDYIESGLVVYQRWNDADMDNIGRRHLQMKAWRAALKAHRDNHQFLAFTDIDEFLVPYGGFKTVSQLLRQMQSFEPIGGLVVNWVMHGSNGHKIRPKGGVLQAYTKCMPLNNEHGIHVKSIVSTDHVVEPITPHHFKYKGGKYAVNEHFQRVDGPNVAHIPGAPTTHYIANHHYFTKSLEEWQQKAKRGSGMGNHKGMEYFEGVDQAATELCLGAAEFAYVR